MPGEENASRADPCAEVHVASAAVLLGKTQGYQVSKTAVIINQGVPPGEVIEEGLGLIVVSLDGPLVFRANAPMPFVLR
jgi:hypothetical protein